MAVLDLGVEVDVGVVVDVVVVMDAVVVVVMNAGVVGLYELIHRED